MYEVIASNRRRTVVLFVVFVGLLLALGFVFSRVFEAPWLLWAAVILSLVSAWGGYFYSDRLVLSVTGARPIRKSEFPELVRIVENLSITSGLSCPSIYVIHDPSPNAFATGRDPKHAAVAVTTGLLKILDKSELEGVIAHELSHIKNYDILIATLAVTLAGAVVLASDFFLRTSFFRSSRSNRGGGSILVVLGLLLAILAPIFATLLQLAVSRKREFLADADAAFLTRYPEGLIEALEKLSKSPYPLQRVSRATAHLFIVDPLKKWGEGWSTLWSTHPPLAARIAALKKFQ